MFVRERFNAIEAQRANALVAAGIPAPVPRSLIELAGSRPSLDAIATRFPTWPASSAGGAPGPAAP